MVPLKTPAGIVLESALPAPGQGRAGAGMGLTSRAGSVTSHDTGRPRRRRPATPHGAGAVSWERSPLSPRQKHPEPLRDVEPAEPIAPWLGGKKNLAKRIIARVEATPHDCYAEPFCGMAGVFLRRTARPKAEILNDINGDIVNLYRVVREHPGELARQFDWTLGSRSEFRRLLEVPPATLTDVQRAARFAYLQNLRFAGKPSGTSVNFGPYYANRMRAPRMHRRIEIAHRRLQGVHIESLPWDVFIDRYDRPFTLFYIDPPYWGHEADYGKGLFARDDFARMAELLRGLKGRFILSLRPPRGARDLRRVRARGGDDALLGQRQVRQGGEQERRRAADFWGRGLRGARAFTASPQRQP